MEFKTCEEKVLWDLEQAENKVAELQEENARMKMAVDYGNEVVNLCQQMIWMEKMTEDEGAGANASGDTYNIVTKAGVICKIDETNNEGAKIIATLKPLFYHEDKAEEKETPPLNKKIGP